MAIGQLKAISYSPWIMQLHGTVLLLEWTAYCPFCVA